jgi:type IV secretory pathway VirB4 component
MDPLIVATIALTAPGAVVLGLEARRQFRLPLPSLDSGPRHAMSKELPYRTQVSPEIVKLKSGAYLCAWEISAKDVGGLDDEDIRKATLQVAVMVGLLPPKAGILGKSNLQVYLMPAPHREYDRASGFDNPVLQVIDDLRADRFLLGEVFRTKRVITLTWQPPSKAVAWLAKQASSGVAAQRHAEDALLRKYDTLRTRVESSLNTRLISSRRLGQYREVDQFGVLQIRADLLGFIQTCITGSVTPINAPHPEMPLDEFFATTATAGHEPKIGNREVAAIFFQAWPDKIVPRVLSKLNEAGIEHALCVRILPKTARSAKKEHKKAAYEYMSEATGSVGFVDPDAMKAKDQAISAYGLASGDFTRNANVTHTLVVRAATRTDLETAQQKIIEIFEAADFRGEVRKDGAMDTILATFPGMFKRGNRRPQFDALTIAKTLDFHEPALGTRYSVAESYPPNTIPLTYALGPGNTLIRVHLHGRRDVGHTLVNADTGNGKSVWASLIAVSQLGRGPDKPGVSLVDRGDSAEQWVKVSGGNYLRLLDDAAYIARGEEPPGFALFENCGDLDEARWLLGFLETILKVNGVIVTPKHSQSIENAIATLADREVEDRSMVSFVDSLVDHAETMRDVFSKYDRDGVLGSLMDRTHDAFNVSKLNAINIDRVMEAFKTQPEYLIPILLAIVGKTVSKVRRMKAALGPRAADLRWLFMFDEFNNSLLKHAVGAGIATDLFTMGRKEGFSLFVFSNSLTALSTAVDFETIKQSCSTYYFGADGAAMSPERYKLYSEKYGLPDRAIRMIAEAGEFEWVAFFPDTGFAQRRNFAIDKDVRAVLGSSQTAHKPTEFQQSFPVADFGPWRWIEELIRENSPKAADRFATVASRWANCS